MSIRVRLRSLLSFSLVIACVVVITILQRPEKAQGEIQANSDGSIRLLAKGLDQAIVHNAVRSIEKGRETFRFDTFGDEAFWGDTLNLDATIAGAANGGIGPGLSPRQALDSVSRWTSTHFRRPSRTSCAPAPSISMIPRSPSRSCS